MEVLGPDGRYQPSFDTETETVQVNDTTTRTVVRTYNWDANGRRKLVEIREQETRTTASGDAQTMRTTSNSDLDGNLFVVLREVEDTRKTSPDAQETKTTVYAADGNGGFTAARQTDEVQQRNADRGVEVHKTTLRPDANGNLRLDEVSRKTSQGRRQDSNHRRAHFAHRFKWQTFRSRAHRWPGNRNPRRKSEYSRYIFRGYSRSISRR